MTEAQTLERRLLAAQNSDGGWGYHAGHNSWTEPTAMALLALSAANSAASETRRGYRWLAETQRSDGGWAPNASVETSTWVTSLGLLACRNAGLSTEGRACAVEWLLQQTPATGAWWYQTLTKLFGKPGSEIPRGGSPWFPGTAAWVGPSVFSILALAGNGPDQRIVQHMQEARQYLLSRRCRDGGWNHGGSRYLSEDAVSYPEMTGLALLAFPREFQIQLAPSLERAQAELKQPASIEALSWLQLGLRAHGMPIPDPSAELPCRSHQDVCLRLLALNAQNTPHALTV